MGRPRKAQAEKFVARQIKFPPALWAEIEEHIRPRERSPFIRQAVTAALLRRAAELLRDYYAKDREAAEWGEFVGDAGDE